MKDPIFQLPPIDRGPEYDVLNLSAGPVNWGMSAFKIDDLRNDTDSGEGIIIGVVDTGCGEHPLLGNVIAKKDCTRSNNGPNDANGHGTHCAGTISATDPNIGVATKCKLVVGKGLGNSGSGSMRDLIDAMDWCASQGAEIISCSWGGGGLDQFTQDALKRYDAAGIWPVFAGGNSGLTPQTDAPGVSMFAFNVAALQQNMTRASFSSTGEKIDTSGPGVDIVSCRPGGGYATMSGTSMATPFIAGMLGCYRAGLKKRKRSIPNVAGLRHLLAQRSTDIGQQGDDRLTGPGWATPLLLALDLVPDPPKPGT